MFERQRRTKILATLGPATDPPGVLEDLFRAGVNVVRLNFSHGDPSGQAKRAAEVRAARPASAWKWASWPTCRARRSASSASPKARCS
jgi:pyruvate kinase